MKKNIILALDVDTDKLGSSFLDGKIISTRGWFYRLFGGVEYTIVVRQSYIPGLFPFSSLLHELGHLVAQVFELPGAKMDPRTSIDQLEHAVDDSLRLHNQTEAEIEAWNVAADIRRFLIARDVSLGTYLAIDHTWDGLGLA